MLDLRRMVHGAVTRSRAGDEMPERFSIDREALRAPTLVLQGAQENKVRAATAIRRLV